VFGVREIILTAILASILLATLSSCEERLVRTERFFAFGTIIELSIRTDDAELARKARSLVNDEVTRMHRDWHAWNPSLLTKTNTQLQSQTPFAGDPEIVELITLAQEFSKQSNGLFDPALGQLVEDWGFYAEEPGVQANITEESIDAWLGDPASVNDIIVDKNQLHGNHPQLQLDFGGIAKGYALDKIADQLEALGAENFILNAGGDLVVRGQNVERHWKVGIRNPRDEKISLGLLVLDGEGVFSSGDYERFYLQNNDRIHHIIDPSTGRPATGARAVTVIHHDAARADAAATALMIASAEDWLRIAAQMRINTAIRYDQDGNIHLTAAMRKRLEFSESLTSAATTDKM